MSNGVFGIIPPTGCCLLPRGVVSPWPTSDDSLGGELISILEVLWGAACCCCWEPLGAGEDWKNIGEEEATAEPAALLEARGVVCEPSCDCGCWGSLPEPWALFPARVGVEAAELFAGRPRRREEAGDDIPFFADGSVYMYRFMELIPCSEDSGRWHES